MMYITLTINMHKWTLSCCGDSHEFKIHVHSTRSAWLPFYFHCKEDKQGMTSKTP